MSVEHDISRMLYSLAASFYEDASDAYIKGWADRSAVRLLSQLRSEDYVICKKNELTRALQRNLGAALLEELL